jgi:predicted ATP-dependent serine protease
MHQTILEVRPARAQSLLSLNMPSVDNLFPGFIPGDFAVLYGSPSVTSFTSLLCIRAQLPVQLGGLDSDVIFIDCKNTFTPNSITRLAQLNHLNPVKARKRIFNFSAFTAYQLTSLIMEKLEKKIVTYNAKVVIISDITSLFLNDDISKEEAHRVYSQVVNCLSTLAKKHQIIVVATHLPHEDNIRNATLREITSTKATTVLSYFKTPYTQELNLEKHPTYILGTAEPPSENMTLTSFM